MVDGLIAGVGMLLTFVPLMAIMFAARAARGFRLHGQSGGGHRPDDGMIGLPGRAFLPLIVGFGCNVLAISATRGTSPIRGTGSSPRCWCRSPRVRRGWPST